MEILRNDAITGLPTLPMIASYFEQLMKNYDQFGMLLIDINGFILFNDRYGHQKGEEN
jgi:GGDEF domain-containing protein